MQGILAYMQLNTWCKNVLKSFFITFALMNIGRISTASIVSICLFLGIYFALEQVVQNYEKKDFWYANLLSILFTLMYVVGGYSELTGGLSNPLFVAVYVVASVLGLFLLFRQLLLVILHKSVSVNIFQEKRRFDGKLFFLLLGIVFIIMVPFFLLNFPAVMTPDSLSQYRQMAGIDGYSDHHPWLHTMLFGMLYHIGLLVSGNVYTGIACYTVFQMLVVAAGESYVITSLYELGLKKKWCVAILLAFVLYPFHLLYSVTIWKDVLFSMAVLILTITLFRLYLSAREGLSFVKNKRDIILFGISGFGMCMFRHNGYYAFILLTLLLLIINRKWLKQYGVMCGVVLLLVIVVKGPIMNVCQVTSGEFAYKLCVPLQQVGRVVFNNRALEQDETELLEKINILDYVKENYQPGGADPMFSWVLYGDREYLETHKMDYLKLWISLGIKYPGDYLNAFVDQTKGYFYPMDPEQVVYFGITENETGLTTQSIIQGPVLIKINELITKLYTMIPVYGIVYSMGAMFWVLLACFGICFRNKKQGQSIAFIPALLLIGTLFVAVPLVADMRYGYPLVLAIPLIVAISYYKPESTT